MDLRDLRCFLEVGKLLHFGQAAEVLGTAQPALSQRIKVLETQLGVRLFDRSRRTVRLTRAGKAFFEEAQGILSHADRAKRIALSAEQGTAGDLRIGYGGSVVFEPKVCRLLQDFRDAYPAISLSMHESRVDDQFEGVRAGKLDIALFWGPIGPGYPDLRHLVFARTSMSVVLRRDHPLAGRESIELAEIADEPFIALTDPPGRGQAHVVYELLASKGLSPKVALRVSSLISVFGLAGAGIGIGLVPTLPIDIISPAFVQRPLADAWECNEILIAAASSAVPAQTQHFLTMAAALTNN